MKRFIKKFLWTLLPFFLAFPAGAQKIKVERLKGNKALVDISGGHVQVGDTFDLSEQASSKTSAVKARGGESRDHLLALSTNLSSLTVTSGSSSVGVSVFTLSGRYGWNMGATEYGGLANFGSVSSNSQSTSTFYLGGFFDFNLTANRASENTLVGFGVEAGAGSANTSAFLSTTSSSTAASTWYAYPSGFLKWFGFGGSFCIRADLGLGYQSIQTNPVQTITGLMGKVGLAQYF